MLRIFCNLFMLPYPRWARRKPAKRKSPIAQDAPPVLDKQPARRQAREPQPTTSDTDAEVISVLTCRTLGMRKDRAISLLRVAQADGLPPGASVEQAVQAVLALHGKSIRM